MTKTKTQALCLGGTKTQAFRLRKGDVAFMPYFGQLVKCRITHVNRDRAAFKVGVLYQAMLPGPDWDNCCRMPWTHEVEVMKSF